MKEELLSRLNHHVSGLTEFQKNVRAVAANRISLTTLKENGNSLCREWFDLARPSLERANLDEVVLNKFSADFENLLQLTRGRSAKDSYLSVLREITSHYASDLIHQIEVRTFTGTGPFSISPYIDGLPVEEGAYLDEAQRCLTVNGIRACIILGWCAAIARIHEKIEKLGFDNFNKASEDMAAKQFGRFKPFNKKFKVESVSELRRTVFDTDLLWVLEYLTLIDSNQHERLRYCFEMRNNSAHPGQAPITGENLYSFYSDITNIILKNPKFSL